MLGYQIGITYAVTAVRQVSAVDTSEKITAT